MEREGSDSGDLNKMQQLSLEEAFSNIHLSSTPSNSLYNNGGVRLLNIQEPILNPSTPSLRIHPNWVQAASYAPSSTMWLPPPSSPSIHHHHHPAAMYHNLTTAQQNIWAPPDYHQYMGPALPSSWSAPPDQSQRATAFRFDATANLQDAIRSMPRDKIEIVFQAVLTRIDHMMTHPTSHYIVQRLIEVADDEQKHRLVAVLVQRRSLLRRLCSDTHGTRVVQKLVENLSIRYQKDYLLLAVQPDVLPLAMNDNGRHVIVQCLRNFSDAENGPILSEVGRNCFAMGRDKSGYLVLTECISCNSWGPNRALVLERIAQTALLLSHDQYGNYVVQHALEQNIPQLTRSILCRLKGNYADLSASKYGSNVVEKCLRCSSREHLEWLIDELLHNPEISRLVAHPYGNYVIQTSLTVSKNLGLEIQHRELLALLRINIAELKISRHGKQLIKWISSSGRELSS